MSLKSFGNKVSRSLKSIARIFSEQPRTGDYEVKGCSGTRIYSGILSEEYLDLLNSRTKRYDIYERMTNGDGITSASFKYILFPILAANYGVRPYSEKPIDKEVAAFVQWNFFEQMSNGFDEHMEEAYTFLSQGHSCFEKEHIKRDWRYVDDEGKEKIVRNMKTIKKFHFRNQRSITKWLFNPDNSFNGFHQTATAPNGKRIDVDIFVPHVVVMSYQKKGDNFDGISEFRPAVKHWTIKDEVYEIEGIGIERKAIGYQYMQERPEHQGSAPNDDDMTKALNLVKSIMAHEEMSGVVRKAWELKELTGQLDTGSIHNCINHHTVMIALSMLCDIMLLGSVSSSGSWALGEVKKETLEKSFMYRIKAFCRAHNKYSIPQLVSDNYTVDGNPELYCIGLSAQDLDAWAKTMETLINATLLDPDKAIKQLVREKFELPEIVEEELEEAMVKEALKPLTQHTLCEIGSLLGTAQVEEHGSYRQLTERERALGLSEEHARNIKDLLKESNAEFVKKAKPIWEQMNEAVQKQLDKSVPFSEIVTPKELVSAYQKLLYDKNVSMMQQGLKAVQKELKRDIRVDKKTWERALKDIEESTKVLAEKDAHDRIYLYVTAAARRRE